MYLEGQPYLHNNVLMAICLTLPFLTAAYNIVTWDRVVLMETMVVGFEVDFAWILQEVINEGAFKYTTTYPFLCMIIEFLRFAGVPVWHIDVINTAPSTVDIGIIWDEANELSPTRGPRPEVQPLGENLADTIEQAQAANPATSKKTDTTPLSLSRVLASLHAPLARLLLLQGSHLVGSRN